MTLCWNSSRNCKNGRDSPGPEHVEERLADEGLNCHIDCRCIGAASTGKSFLDPPFAEKNDQLPMAVRSDLWSLNDSRPATSTGSEFRLLRRLFAHMHQSSDHSSKQVARYLRATMVDSIFPRFSLALRVHPEQCNIPYLSPMRCFYVHTRCQESSISGDIATSVFSGAADHLHPHMAAHRFHRPLLVPLAVPVWCDAESPPQFLLDNLDPSW